MKKAIVEYEVENCALCPFQYFNYCLIHPCFMCAKSDKELTDTDAKIPDWCELEDSNDD